MRNLLYIAGLMLALASCEKDPIEDVMVPPTMTIEPTTPKTDETTDTTTTNTSSNTTTGVSSETTVETGTTTDTTGTEPKTAQELQDELDAQNCTEDYIIADCGFYNDFTLFYNQLGVRDGYSLRQPQQYYIDLYDTAKSRTNEEFENVVGQFSTVIEDNTERGSFSFAGACGTSWHDSHTPTEDEAVVGTLVHEWGHVWHSQMTHCLLTEIYDAWSAQREAYEAGEGYDQILTVVGGDKENPVYGWNGETYPYQLSNDGEYMACNIAAYFNSPLGAGTIQSREHLREQDPVIFALIERLLN